MTPIMLSAFEEQDADPTGYSYPLKWLLRKQTVS
jgi:hypothetical protein